ncbi:MAG: hypothetical protein M1453_08145 [Acidobacteria bacterium]|nr:hypothetical protein [Acidobacteriota bacterium]MCL5287948.1 hypothetical protein [Acidobacteriota bacterium]
MPPRTTIAVFLLAALLSVAAPLSAQDISSREAPPEIPFEAWIADAKHVDLPCSVKISSARLSILQRFVVEFRVTVPPKALALLGPTYQLFLDVRLKPAGDAGWLENHDISGTRLTERLPKQSYLEFSLQALVQPGEYKAGFILFDRISGLRSVALRTFKVRPLNDDPLPEITRDVPVVEFFQRGLDENREPLPELHSRLWIPVESQRPVRIELLVNVAPPEPQPFPPGQSIRSSRNLSALQQRNVARMLGIIKVLSQMEVANGSLHITAMDLQRRTVVFEQDVGSELDWLRLHGSLKQINPLSIPVQALEGRRQNAAFLRELLQQRMPAAPPARAHAENGGNGGSDGHSASPEPLRVFIVASCPVLFERGADLSPVKPPRGADIRVYHLQYQLGFSNLWDDLPRVLRELAPRRFELQNPEEFRRALARILADLRAL